MRHFNCPHLPPRAPGMSNAAAITRCRYNIALAPRRYRIASPAISPPTRRNHPCPHDTRVQCRFRETLCETAVSTGTNDPVAKCAWCDMPLRGVSCVPDWSCATRLRPHNEAGFMRPWRFAFRPGLWQLGRMSIEREPGRRVHQQLRAYFSELQTFHHEQLDPVDELQDQVDHSRSSLIQSQTAELDRFRETKRRIESIVDDPHTDDVTESDQRMDTLPPPFAAGGLTASECSCSVLVLNGHRPCSPPRSGSVHCARYDIALRGTSGVPDCHFASLRWQDLQPSPSVQ